MRDDAPTPVFRDTIDHPSAWTNASLGGKEGITYRLTEQQLVAFEEVIDRTRHLHPQEVSRRDFDHPVVNGLLEELRDEIMNGRGTVLISGITRDRFSEDEFERIYFGAGTHWGIAAIQSLAGDRLGHVRNEKDNPKNRAYLSARELKMHSDAYEVIGLMCVEKAETGGYSRLASALAIHNEILRNRPDLLEPLYRGFPYATAGMVMNDARTETRADASPTALELRLTDVPDKAVRELIRESLERFNDEATGIPDEHSLDVLVVDPSTQETLGGLVGRTSLGVLFISFFFLHEALRRQGLGSALPRRAEEEARRRGCRRSLCSRSPSRRPRSMNATVIACSDAFRASRRDLRGCS